MNFLPTIWGDILTRLQSDTGTDGLWQANAHLVTGIYNDMAKLANVTTTDFPLITYALETCTPSDSFRTRSYECTIQVDLWHERYQADGGASFGDCGAILRRIAGNWEGGAAFVAPTYGLARWTPGLSGSGYTATWLEEKSVVEAHTDEVLHWIITYGFRASKVGA